MPIYPGRRKGTWRVTVWSAGRQHEEIVEGSRADAREHEARLRLALGARSRRHQRIAPSFFDFSTTTYPAHARARLGASTWRARKYFVRTLVAHFGPHRLDALEPAMVEAFVASRLSAGLGPSSVNQELLALRSLLRVARELGLPVADVPVRLLKAPERRVRAWTPAEIARLFAAARRLDPELRPMLVVLLNTGMRKGEAIVAPWDWVDWKRRLLCVAPTEHWSPKSKRPREIPISDEAWKALRSLPQNAPRIFPTREGAPRARFPDDRFAAVVKAAGLRGGPHTCRHTFASLYLRAGGTLYELSQLLGHSTTRTTELYAHMLPGHLEKTRNVVNVSASGTLAKTLAKRTKP